MLQSKLFTKTRKEAPSEEVSTNAKLLIRAGFIHKEMAGIYAYLPLGLKVLNKISNIVREEMDAIGGIEIQLTALQDKEKWIKSGRWDDNAVDVWFKTKLKNDTELGLGFTHDEQLVDLLKDHVNSYKDLPFYPYQIQTKFRNELRSKSGIMRGKEFLMKDLYSFNATETEQDEFYEKIKDAYMNVFKRCGIGDKTYLTFSSGGTFSKYSHEFQTLTESGEDKIYLSEEKNLAINEEVYNDEVLSSLGLDKSTLKKVSGVEVANIFKQGTRYTKDLKYKDSSGVEQVPFMGGYGIGISRLMGTIVEVLSDDKGIVWPEQIAPFNIHLIALLPKEGTAVINEAQRLYGELQKSGVEVLLDDRDVTAGAKFADSDLIGIPYRVVVSEKTIEKGAFELVERKTGKTEFITEKELLEKKYGGFH